MPPTKTPSRGAARGTATKAQPAGSRFSRAVGRFKSQRPATQGGKAGGLIPFLRDVRLEIRKVEWPNREELVKLTGAVVGLSALVGVFLGGVDFLFQELFKLVIALGSGGV
jgi:preprotein translocase subunit SecE